MGETQVTLCAPVLTSQRTPTAYRNRAMILTFQDTGLRVGELCHLETPDVDIHGGWIKVRRGKG